MRPTTVQHLRFLEHSLTPHDVLFWNAAHGVPALGARLPVRRRRPALLGALHALGGSRSSAGARALDWLAHVRRRPPRHAAGRVRLRRTRSTSWLGEPRAWTASSRCWTPATGRCCTRESTQRRPAWSARTPASSTTVRPAPCARCRGPHAERPRRHRLPGPQPARTTSGHHGQLKHRDRATSSTRRPGPAGLRTDISTRLRGDEVRRRLVRVPGQRPLRDRHARAARARSTRAARSGASRPPWRRRAPRRHLRGVLGAAGARAGTTTTSRRSARGCSRPRRRRPASCWSRAPTTASSSPRRTTAAAPRPLRPRRRRWSASATRPRPRPSRSARGAT